MFIQIGCLQRDNKSFDFEDLTNVPNLKVSPWNILYNCSDHSILSITIEYIVLNIN